MDLKSLVNETKFDNIQDAFPAYLRAVGGLVDHVQSPFVFSGRLRVNKHVVWYELQSRCGTFAATAFIDGKAVLPAFCNEDPRIALASLVQHMADNNMLA